MSASLPLRRAMELCEFCPKMCRFSCPVSEATAREALTPWGKVSLAALTTGGGRAPDVSAALAFAGCTGCLRCQQYCAHGNDVPSVLYAARAAAVRAGVAPEAWTAVALRIASVGHCEDEDIAGVHRALLEEQVEPERAPESTRPAAAAILFAGCDALAAGGGAVRDALAVARALGAPLALAPEGALCCGLKLVEAGHPELFAAHALRGRAALQGAGSAREKRRRFFGSAEPLHVVFLSPGCARAVAERWSDAGAALPRGSRVEHVTTYLARALAARPDLRERPQLPFAVAYHDPCELARGLVEVTSPRALLAAALAGGVREPLRCGADTSCCGAGGLLPLSLPDVFARLLAERKAELAACGAPVVTASPACAKALEAGDVVGILARWLGVATSRF